MQKISSFTDSAILFEDHIIQQPICKMLTFAKLRHSQNQQLVRYAKRYVLFARVCYLIFWVLYEKFSSGKSKNEKKLHETFVLLKKLYSKTVLRKMVDIICYYCFYSYCCCSCYHYYHSSVNARRFHLNWKSVSLSNFWRPIATQKK